jgi:predicted ATPase
MLTRLCIQGFKNLVDVSLRLGPLTVIAGANGIGKSNLFDAIQLLSSLSEKSVLDAVTGVRQETSSANAIRIFTQTPSGPIGTIKIIAEMLVGPEVKDDLDQIAKPTARHLRYTIELRHSRQTGTLVPKIEIIHESLDYLKREESTIELPFAKRKNKWLHSVQGGIRTKPLISTLNKDDGAYIRIHEDSGHQGRSRVLKASTLTRTILSTINSIENPTALAAKREMQSWRLLQLEPTKLRSPSEWREKPELGPDGNAMPATLHRLLYESGQPPENVEARLVSRLFDLIGEVRSLSIDKDEKRETFTILVGFKNGLNLRARDLSDGTLRFLALATLEADPSWGGIICMEEPENGIHPTRIPAMLNLLQSLAVDVNFAVGEDNPLRQVIVNTHSPEVVALAPESTVLLATQGWAKIDDVLIPTAEFRPLKHTWRDQTGANYSTMAEISEYLRAIPMAVGGLSPFSPDDCPVAGRPEIRPLFLEGLE